MKLIKQESGITGLETAIIFIAFVVLSAVFVYSVLSAGLFTTQKSQEAINSGLKKSESSVMLRSQVTGKAEHTGDQGYLSQITFVLSTMAGGEALDFTRPLTTGTDGIAPAGSANAVTISYKDDFQQVDDLFWTAEKMGRDNGNNMLDPGEKLQVTIGSAATGEDGGNLVDALTAHSLGPDTLFSIEIKTVGGAVLDFERITPAWIDKINNLDTNSGVNLHGAD